MIRLRPHTRTQCQEGNQCAECCGLDAGHFVAPTSYAGAVTRRSSAPTQAASSSTSSQVACGSGIAGSGSGVEAGQIKDETSSTHPNNKQNKRAVVLVELPAELLVKILSYLSFKEISHVRLVSRRFNEICASMLNSTFHRLQSHMWSRVESIKSQMPRRESARRNHPLARESDIVETLHMRLTLLQMTFGKHIERKHVCFFAGEILDEVQRIMRYIRQTQSPSLYRVYKIADELFDLSTMAMEYFKEHIEPTFPQITYFGAEFLDFASFTTPTKRRSQSGSASNFGLIGGSAGGSLDSPCSSRASVAGSSVSEQWSTASTMPDSADFESSATFPQPPQATNMVLRKRIRRIRQGMKRYNDQLVEVKKELKTCKTKMETQTKTVAEYSSRLEVYDKKFEESSRKFQTLLTELNKCKTELQYWRSKSTTLLSLPPTCTSCEAPFGLQPAANLVAAEDKVSKELKALLTDDSIANSTGSDTRFINDSNPSVQKVASCSSSTFANDLLMGGGASSSSSSCNPRGASKSGPPSPASAASVGSVGGRKRRSRDENPLAAASTASNLEEIDASGGMESAGSGSRKSSLRGGVSTRVKRLKVASTN